MPYIDGLTINQHPMAHIVPDARSGHWRLIKMLTVVRDFATTREVEILMTTYALTTVLGCCACLPLLLYSSIESYSQKVSVPETRLASCRQQIDETDRQIVALLNQRARIVAEVGKIKQEAHLPVEVPAREQQVLDHIVKVGDAGPLPPDRLRRIYQTVLQEMRTWEEEMLRASESKPAK